MCSNTKICYLTENSKNCVNNTENQIATNKSANNNIFNDNDYKNYEDLFGDEDVQRFDADSYRQRYGDKWKKLATTVRDVVQSDGTIIREYVIEDPSLLEQLSEDDDNISNLNNYSNNSNNKNNNNTTSHDNEFDKNQNSNCLKEMQILNKAPYNSIFNHNYYIDNQNSNKNEKSINDLNNITNKQPITKSAVEINKYFQPIQTTISQPKLTNMINSTPNMQIIGQPNQLTNHSNVNNGFNSNTNNPINSQSPNTPLTNITPLNFTNKSSSSSSSSSNSATIRMIKDEEENDKEVEKIHEQGKLILIILLF
jgi:hypothetical protein